MSPLDEVLCHCDADQAGHAPGAGGCPNTIKSGTYGRPLVGGAQRTPRSASGTCPDCGRHGVAVKRAEVRTTDRPDVHDLNPGVVVAIRPALAAHKTPGRGGVPCGGAGKVPAETRYRSAQIEAMVRDFGAEAVA